MEEFFDSCSIVVFFHRGSCSSGIVEVDCPIVEVYPIVSVVVPLDCFPFEGTGAFLGVKVVDPSVVGEGVGELLWVDPFLRVDITPPMSGSWGVDSFVDPKGKDVTFSFDFRAEMFFKLGVDKSFFFGVEGVVRRIGFFTPFPPAVHTRVTV